jgi:dienelactone hydrolase
MRTAIKLACAALLLAAGATQAQEKVQFPSLDKWKGEAPLTIDGYLYKPAGKDKYAAIAMFHGCAGALDKNGRITSRFREMAAVLGEMGYGVLLIDSFNPRGTREICTTRPRQREIHEEQRWMDAFGAIDYLNTRPDVLPGKIAALGFSHGGTNALEVMNANLPPKKAGKPGFVASVAMYPGCGDTVRATPEFQAYGPLLILGGELDDWTPVEYCQRLSDRSRARGEPVELVVYPGAYHGFDMTTPVRVRTDVTHGRNGAAGVRVGGQPEARADAYKRIREFFATHLGS